MRLRVDLYHDRNFDDEDAAIPLVAEAVQDAVAIDALAGNVLKTKNAAQKNRDYFQN